MLDLLERHDSFALVRNALRAVAAEKDEWAGIPLPIDGEKLVIEPSYPFAEALSGKCEPWPDNIKIRNEFHSHRRRCNITVFELDGKVEWVRTPAVHGAMQALQTIGASFAWGIEQEHRALELLGSLVKHVAFKQYLLTGMFLETSQRSGLTYWFRKLRPTVALNTRGDRVRILCALCMHPIAYYAGSWGGAMCPTDDVVAHLMMMRGDEAMFWRRCNQHPAHLPESGL